MSFTGSYSHRGISKHTQFGEIIATDTFDVLPRLPPASIVDALRRLPPEELALSLRSKLVPLVSLPGLKLFVACGRPALALAQADGLKVVAFSEAADFIAAARAAHGPALLDEATSGLKRRMPEFSASRRLTRWQIVACLAVLVLASTASLLLPGSAAWLAASSIAGLFFLSVIALRLLCLLPPLRPRDKDPPHLEDGELPVYSVLVPLFRETSVLNQLLKALTAIDYPPEKLDIKLILEENDIIMQRAVAGLPLPDHFDVIVVPSGKPQTKPRAMNYALQFSRGTLLTIFDAEDLPQPSQLRSAAAAFAALPQETACLQAQLVFYNPAENWLTKQFTIEYAALFGVILPVLAAHRLPLPLGGTSNHFRCSILRQVGGWDPYNVTEDADLGMRLARLGYSTGTIRSRTYEEANVRLLNWLRQRARWLKGFLATWLVHMRRPGAVLGELGPAAFWTLQAITFGVFTSALLHPACLIATVLLVVLDPPDSSHAHLALIVLAGVNLLIFVSGYAVTMIIGHRAIRQLGIKGWLLPVLTMPAYWLLMSAAAWLALWQFIVAPFHWNKTEHGLSALQRRRTRMGGEHAGTMR